MSHAHIASQKSGHVHFLHDPSRTTVLHSGGNGVTILPQHFKEDTSLKLQAGSVDIKNMGTLQFRGEDSSDHGSISCTKTGNSRTLTVNSDVSTLLGEVQVPEALYVTTDQGDAQTTLDNLTVGYDTTLADVNVGGALKCTTIEEATSGAGINVSSGDFTVDGDINAGGTIVGDTIKCATLEEATPGVDINVVGTLKCDVIQEATLNAGITVPDGDFRVSSGELRVGNYIKLQNNGLLSTGTVDCYNVNATGSITAPLLSCGDAVFSGGISGYGNAVITGSIYSQAVNTGLQTGNANTLIAELHYDTSLGPNLKGYVWPVHIQSLNLNGGTAGSVGIKLMPDGFSSTTRVVEVYGHLYPSNNSTNLGENGGRAWGNIYYKNGITQVSDRAKKENIVYEMDTLANELLKLKPCSYSFIDSSGGTHLGLIAQDVEETLFAQSVLVKTPKKEKVVHEIPGEPAVEEYVTVDGYDYGLDYHGFISPMIRLLQMQQTQIYELQQQVAQLQAAI